METEHIPAQQVFWRLYVAAILENEDVLLIDRRRVQLERSGVNADAVELAYRLGCSRLRQRREFPGALLASSGEDPSAWN